MSRNIVTEGEDETEDDRIVQLVSSGVSRGNDGNAEVYLCPEEEAWTRETGLRLTEDDALALRDALGQAAEFVAGRDPQAFIRLVICEPPTDLLGRSKGESGEPSRGLPGQPNDGQTGAVLSDGHHPGVVRP